MPYRSARSCVLVVVCIATTAFLALTPSAFAQSVWNGGAGNWSNPLNWSGGVPISTSNVLIGGASSNATLDVDSTVTNFTLDAGNTLTFDQNTLVVNGAATLNGTTNLDFGTLTLNGSAVNMGTITLQTFVATVNGQKILEGIGIINGAGTLDNAGTIQGAGRIDLPLINSGIVSATDPGSPLSLSGNVNNLFGILQGDGGTLSLNGAMVTNGIVRGQIGANSGATLTNAQFGFEHVDPGVLPDSVTFTPGSTLAIQGTVINQATLNLGGATLNGPGTLVNRETIQGTGTIAANINNLGNSFNTPFGTAYSNSFIRAQGGTLTLMGNVDNTPIFAGLMNGIDVQAGAALVLDGAHVTGGAILRGQVTAQNGATVNNVTFGDTLFGGGSLTLTGGSTLGIQGTLTNNVSLTLGSGGVGVTLDGPGTLLNKSVIASQGTTLITTDIQNRGTGSSNSLINISSGTLTLTGNVDSTSTSVLPLPNGITMGSAGALVLDGAHVTGGAILRGQVTAQNGATVNNVTFGDTLFGGGSLTLTGGSTLGIQGTLTNDVSLTLGSGGVGVTLSGPGTLVSQGLISTQGTTLITTDIKNQGTGSSNSLINISAGTLTLTGNVDNTSTSVLLANGINVGSGAALVLDGAHVTGGAFFGGQLTAQNGATVNNMTFGNPFGFGRANITLTGGSALGIQGTLTNVANLTLGSGGAGATLSSVGGTLVNGDGTLTDVATIHGGGNLNVAIVNNGTIIADNPSVPLVISGNVTDPNGLSVLRATNGGTLTIDPATVNAQIVSIEAGSKLNGVGTINVNDNVANGGVLAPGLGAPGTLTINGTYTQSSNFTSTGILDFALGGGQPGQYSQLGVSDFALFDAGSIIEADFFNGFDPSADCATVSGVCDTFDILHLKTGFIETNGAFGISGLDFELPTLAAGLTWSEVDPNHQDILLEITSSGGSGGTGGGGGGTTNTPEPPTVLLLGVGLIVLGSAAKSAKKWMRSAEA